MALSAKEVRDLISQAFPNEFPQHLLRCVFASWQESWLDGEKYDRWSERLYEWPHRRRADVEQNVRTLAGRLAFRRTITATTETTVNGSSKYTKLAMGRLALTISAARSPMKVIRTSKFRQANAVGNTLDLFEPNKLDPADTVYGILIHGQTSGAKKRGWQLFEKDPTDEAGLYVPSFCRIAVPTADFKSYAGEYDLFREHTDVLIELLQERNITRPKRPDLWPSDDFGTGTA